MAFLSGTTEVGADTVPLCPVGRGRTVTVKNLTGTPVFLGGEDVAADGDSPGYPLDGQESQVFTAPGPREAVAVPAPAGDMAPEILYGRTAGEVARVAWIAAG